MKLDKSKFIVTFLVEVREYLSLLDQGIVKLEKDPDNVELLSELFRAAHTLKGSSRMMGFMKVQNVAHRLESLFELLKNGEKKCDASVADQVFKALDVIKAALANIAQGKEEGIDVEEVSERLEEGNVIPAKAGIHKYQKLDPGFRRDDVGSDDVESLAPEATEQDEYIRVPLSRINHLLNLIGEMVISKVKSTYKMGFLKKLTKQAQLAEKMLFDLETSIKETLDIPDEWIHNKGNILRASKEMEKAQHLSISFIRPRRSSAILDRRLFPCPMTSRTKSIISIR